MNIQELAKQAGFEQVMRHRDGSSTVLPTALFERFAALVLEEAAIECDKRAHAGDAGALMAARAIRALKGAK